MSYNGCATLAVVADARLVPDPDAITAGFAREFARMLRAARAGRAAPARTAAGRRKVRGPAASA
jgi:hypothetical protein